MMIQSQCSMSAPHFARGLDDEAQLGVLLVPIVSALPSTVDEKPHCGLRQSCSSGTYLRGLVDPALQLVLAFERRALAGDEAEHHLASFPRGTKRNGSKPPERASSYSRKKPSTASSPNKRLGDMVVAALGHPGRAEIAAAHMGAHGHARGLAGERLVDQADVGQVLRCRRRRRCSST